MSMIEIGSRIRIYGKSDPDLHHCSVCSMSLWDKAYPTKHLFKIYLLVFVLLPMFETDPVQIWTITKG